MRGLDIQSCAIDGSIVRRGRIVRPFAAGIPVLPPGNGYVGSVCGQGNLRGRNRTLCIVLEELLAADPDALRMERGLNQAESNVRNDVDGDVRFRVGVCDVAQIREQTGGHAHELVLHDGEHAARCRFARREHRLRARAFFALPCDTQPGGTERKCRLIGEYHRRQNERGRGGPIRIQAAARVWVGYLHFG